MNKSDLEWKQFMKFKDIADEPEDERIRQIGEKTMRQRKKTVAFITDDEPGKADRYIKKLTERFPGLRVVSRGPGPVAKTVFVKVAPPSN